MLYLQAPPGSPALLIVTSGRAVGLAAGVAPALLMETPGLAVGLLAARMGLALLMETLGPTVGLATRVALALLMAAPGLIECPTPSSTRCWAASGSHLDGAGRDRTTLAQRTRLQVRLDYKRRPFILQPLCVLLLTPSRRHLKIPQHE